MARMQPADSAFLRAVAELVFCRTEREALDQAASALAQTAGGASGWIAVASAQGPMARGPAALEAKAIAAAVQIVAERSRSEPGPWLTLSGPEAAALRQVFACDRLFVAPVRGAEVVAGGVFVGARAGSRAPSARRETVVLLAQHLGAVLGQITLRRELEERSRQLVATQAQLDAYARDMRVTYEAERERHRQVRRAYEDTIRILATAIEERDEYTGAHVERVAAYAVAIGREIGLADDELHGLEMGAILHDIGKIAITDGILRKDGQLLPAEWQQIREHPDIGARMLQHIPFLSPALGAVIAHHERVDGHGYPRGLSASEIPLAGRIVAVADTFDAITTDRPYRPARSVADALDELRREAGAQFDGDVVAAFQRVWQTGQLSAHLPSVPRDSIS